MKTLGSFIIIFVFIGCAVSKLLHPELNELPKGFPEISYPEGNEFSEARWKLGKRLFFDTILSRDQSISCSSCHIPSLAFSDSLSFSFGSESAVGVSNAPTLTNVAFNKTFNRDGGVPTLEMQILVPIQEHVEFNMNILEIAERMKLDSSYIKMSLEAYNRQPDPFVITRSLANFERTLISGNSPYDQFMFQNNKKALSESAQAGMDIFFSDEAKCSTCHSGFNFTNSSFKNNGLHVNYQDSGRIRITKKETDRATFKVPTLRNIGFTAPYMHDGSIQTLEQVIEHYSSGIKPHKNLSDLKPQHFSEEEKAQLLSFLISLNDSSFVNNPKFKKL